MSKDTFVPHPHRSASNGSAHGKTPAAGEPRERSSRRASTQELQLEVERLSEQVRTLREMLDRALDGWRIEQRRAMAAEDRVLLLTPPGSAAREPSAPAPSAAPGRPLSRRVSSALSPLGRMRAARARRAKARQAPRPRRRAPRRPSLRSSSAPRAPRFQAVRAATG